VVAEHLDKTAKASTYNPKGLPERTITEARVFEFGPVTYPAYAGASAGIRSLTDWYLKAA
jgi:phage head maturation protease